MARVKRRTAIITDEVTGLDVPARRVRQDEHGRYTTDPDAPHPQRFLLPVAPERQEGRLAKPQNAQEAVVLIGLGFNVETGQSDALPSLRASLGDFIAEVV